MTEKRNIHALIEQEAPSLNNLLDPEDVKEFKAMTAELRDTWTCLLYTSPSPRDGLLSRMPSSA